MAILYYNSYIIIINNILLCYFIRLLYYLMKLTNKHISVLHDIEIKSDWMSTNIRAIL